MEHRTLAVTQAKFQTAVEETLQQHETSIGQINTNVEHINATLKTMLADLQDLHSQTLKNAEERLNGNYSTGGPSFSKPSPHSRMGQPSNFFEANPTRLKIDFPRFNARQESQQVQLASFHLDGLALQWYRWLGKFRGPLTWNEFTRAVLHRFGPTNYDNPSEALARLKQVPSVTLYQAEFEKLSQQIDHLPESHLVGCFLAGLRDDIRVELKMKQPRSLSEAIGDARLIEERNQLQRRNMGAQRATLISLPQRAAAQTSTGLLGPPPANRINSTDSLPVRRISAQEARERQSKGLCFYCDEKFVPGHRCNKPQLYMIAEPTPHDGEREEMIIEISDIENSLPEISLHAITGATHP
ncbi:hypothetical protein FEM48_Zijuj01G0041900 [Ziziphus jujuba var. spinosa]|uniref:Retrotransposon gag domain-containing protein n=1 Tax=Ziziphus jujuba var. spinosa TaxID=714518 RepID=A0A978VZ29_ZIZJJ|nr:hypothetical protein FEM48_Zijuj01G0041900 [Ziziphus jujuba var. spinosa]